MKVLTPSKGPRQRTTFATFVDSAPNLTRAAPLANVAVRCSRSLLDLRSWPWSCWSWVYFRCCASRGSAKAAKAGESRTRRASERERRAQDEGSRADERERRTSSRRASTQRSSSSRRSSSRRSSTRRSSGARRHVDAPAARSTSTQYADLDGADVRMLSNSEIEGRRASAATEGRWEPVEAPLPGYLDSARATRMPRNLDSTANGDWTSERMLEQAEALRTPGADAEFELGLDEFVDIPGTDSADDHGYGHRRAVND